MTDPKKTTGAAPKLLAALAAVLVAVIAAVTGVDLGALLEDRTAGGGGAPAQDRGPAARATSTDDAAEVARLFDAAEESDEIVEVAGEVVHILPDDTEGEPHQVFLLELSNGMTLKVSHNTRVAPRIDGLRRGDRVRLRGEYEWNEKGGVVHWTHRTLGSSRHESGWIEHAGRRYE